MSGAQLLGIAPFPFLGKSLVQGVLDLQDRGFVAFNKIGVVAVEISQAIAESPGCTHGNLPFEGG